MAIWTPAAIERSVETRMMEAVRRDFLADAFIATYFTNRIYVGPLSNDPASIVPPQINIALAPSDIYKPGTGGVSVDGIPILVGVYFPVTGQDEPFAVGPDSVNPHDYVKHLQLIILNGSIDPYTGARNEQGFLLDPDYTVLDPAPVPLDARRWLNIACYGCTKQVALFTKDNAAMVIPFVIDYEVRVITLTGQQA